MDNSPLFRKKEIKKAWLFTIILHLVIAGVLITYWFFNKSQKPDPVATNLQTPQTQVQPVEPNSTALPPLKTELASVPPYEPMPTENSTTIASATQTAQTLPAPVENTQNTQNNITPPIPVSAPVKTETNNPNKERPLTKYINSQTPNSNVSTNKTANTATTQNTNKQGLTQRDLLLNEMPKTQNTNKQKAEQQEITKLSQEVEKENDKISQLIEQVKHQNQRKIDENIAKNRVTEPEKPKQQEPTKTEPVIEKVEKLLPTPIPVEIPPPQNDSNKTE